MQVIQTNKQRQLKSRILVVASQAFRLYGIKSVKMDDIAASLKISKRTLYETYQNKEELLFDVMANIIKERKERIEEYSRHTGDVMELLLEFMRIQTEMVANTNPVFFHELSRYPGLVTRLNDLHSQDESLSQTFFLKGVSEGYFRRSVNYELLVKIFRGINEMFCNGGMFRKYDIHDIFHTFACSFLRGVCTEKGIRQIDTFLDNLSDFDQKKQDVNREDESDGAE